MYRVVVQALRARGVDAVTALDVGMEGRADAAHLEAATAQARVLCTFNAADFLRLHAEYLRQGRTHSGIIIMRQQRYSAGELMRRLLRVAVARSVERCRTRRSSSAAGADGGGLRPR